MFFKYAFKQFDVREEQFAYHGSLVVTFTLAG